MPLVSIIIPAYNPGSMLRDALSSLVEQSLTDWEAIVVDDGSAQDLSWVEGFDPRIKLIQQANQGPAAARNHGVAQSGAAFVAFLDADDRWLPRKLEVQIQAMVSADAGLCSTTFEFINDEGIITGQGYGSSARTYNDLLRGDSICTSTVMVRRSILEAAGGFSKIYQPAEDWDLWLRVSALTPLMHIDMTLVQYRRHDAQTTTAYRDVWRACVRLLSRHLWQALNKSNTQDFGAAVRGLGRMNELFGVQALDAFRAHRKISHLGWALTLAPGFTVKQFARRTRSLASRRLL